MAVPEAASSRIVRLAPLWMAVLLTAIFAYGLSGLTEDDLWQDEAWTAWAITPRDPRQTLAILHADVHPPLYFALMWGWDKLAGDSPFALRYPALLAGLVGLAAAAALARRWFGWRGAVYAVLLLGLHSFWLYYAREARMYSLLMALAALSTLFYWRWRRRPTRWRLLAYGASLAALPYVHYAGALIGLSHLLHGLLPGTHRRRLWQPFALACVLLLPWLPVFIGQISANPGGPLALPVATDAAAVAALVLLLTGGATIGCVITLMLTTLELRKRHSLLVLLLLWLLLTPVALLVANAVLAPVYQVRYVIALLPAWALLLAAGLVAFDRFRLPALVKSAAPLFLLVLLASAQINTWRSLWPPKLPWSQVMREAAALRSPLEPILTDFAPYSPAAYYAERSGLTQGFAVDLSWRLHAAGEARERAAALSDQPVLWAALPLNTAKSWHLLAELDRERAPTYRTSLLNMVFYRFASGEGDLRFRFGDYLVTALPDAGQQFAVPAGGELCVQLGFTGVDADAAERHAIGLHLVDLSGSMSLAQWDSPIAPVMAPCLVIPPQSAGFYHLELTLYDRDTGARLPLQEVSTEPAVAWGSVLSLAAVDVMARP